VDLLGVIARGVTTPTQHPTLGPVTQLRSPLRLSRTPPTITRPAPLLGQHSAEILRSLGFDDDSIAALHRRGAIYERSFGPDGRGGLATIDAPTLVLAGDEDEACLDPGLLLKRTIRTAGLMVLPNTGHALNLEEPELFNRILRGFLRAVESGRWPTRDPRTAATSQTGIETPAGSS
jgi:pimeloyl-ACP methyl ester carboxylesterase